MLKHKRLDKLELYSILTGVFCACIIISDVLALKLFQF